MSSATTMPLRRREMFGTEVHQLVLVAPVDDRLGRHLTNSDAADKARTGSRILTLNVGSWAAAACAVVLLSSAVGRAHPTTSRQRAMLEATAAVMVA